MRIFFLTAFLVACGEKEIVFCPDDPPTGRTLTLPASINLYQGDSLFIPVARNPASTVSTAQWSSSSATTATITSAGLLKGISPGTANITLKETYPGGDSASGKTTVTVLARPAGYVKSIKIDPISLRVGDSTFAVVTVDADPGVSTEYTCWSSNAAYVIVKQPANSCSVKLVVAYPAGLTPIPEVVVQTKGTDQLGNKLQAKTSVTMLP